MKVLIILLSTAMVASSVFAASDSDAELKRAAEQLNNALNGKSESTRSSLPIEDRKAYDALRERGVSPDESKEGAAALKRFCNATGGKDCE